MKDLLIFGIRKNEQVSMTAYTIVCELQVILKSNQIRKHPER